MLPHQKCNRWQVIKEKSHSDKKDISHLWVIVFPATLQQAQVFIGSSSKQHRYKHDTWITNVKKYVASLPVNSSSVMWHSTNITQCSLLYYHKENCQGSWLCFWLPVLFWRFFHFLWMFWFWVVLLSGILCGIYMPSSPWCPWLSAITCE